MTECFNITIVPDTILELKGNESEYFTVGLVESSEVNLDPERENCTIYIQDNDCEFNNCFTRT